MGQDCLHLHRATEYRKCGNAKVWAVRTKLGWLPLPQQENAKLATEILFPAKLDPLAGPNENSVEHGIVCPQLQWIREVRAK